MQCSTGHVVLIAHQEAWSRVLGEHAGTHSTPDTIRPHHHAGPAVKPQPHVPVISCAKTLNFPMATTRLNHREQTLFDVCVDCYVLLSQAYVLVTPKQSRY